VGLASLRKSIGAQVTHHPENIAEKQRGKIDALAALGKKEGHNLALHVDNPKKIRGNSKEKGRERESEEVRSEKNWGMIEAEPCLYRAIALERPRWFRGGGEKEK